MNRPRDAIGEVEDIRVVRPNLPRKVMVLISAFIEDKGALTRHGIASELRKLHEDWKDEEWCLELRAIALVLADLLDQGWEVIAVGSSIELRPPGLRLDDETVEQAKLRLREALRVARTRQLDEPGVRAFLKRMQRVVPRGIGRTSIVDVIDDGAELAEKLQSLVGQPMEKIHAGLAQLFDPVVEACDDNSRCPETGLHRMDIWRYFRHTWSLEYRSIPGRQLNLLIRNAARPRRPVMGIAMLASPVVRMKSRDNWIGWSYESFTARIASGTLPAAPALAALMSRLDQSISEIRTDDLATDEELRSPSERTILRLEQRAEGAAVTRERELQRDYAIMIDANEKIRSQRDPSKQILDITELRALSEDPLYVYKRADTLWRLLDAKRVFLSLDWSLEGDALYSQVCSHPRGERALGIALQEQRKAGLSSQVADVSVCGAVAPYNALLCGKLVALLMASAEVHDHYRQRYSGRPSIISSQMAGRQIFRPAELKVLTTTSLYGNGSSQYNRLKLSASRYPDLDFDLEWEELAKTVGYGTYHLAPMTMRVLREVAERTHGARRINNRFGEGASPRLRQTREALEALGIDSASVLHHATPRVSYGCELHPGAMDELLGLRSASTEAGSSAAAIADAWRKRWLANRISQPEILDRVARLGPAAIKADLQIPDANGQFEMIFDPTNAIEPNEVRAATVPGNSVREQSSSLRGQVPGN